MSKGDFCDMATDFGFCRVTACMKKNTKAEPVKHGKWIDIDEQTYTWNVRCSCCGHERSMMSTQGNYPNYCEACGARMDKE
jgi:hypothetical protein